MRKETVCRKGEDPTFPSFLMHGECCRRNTNTKTVIMKPTRLLAAQLIQCAKEFTAIICMAALASGSAMWAAPPQEAAPASSDAQAAKLPADQLDSLVAPIALYPDPMLSNVLMASTYPLEIIQLQQWLVQNKNLKDKALADAVQKQFVSAFRRDNLLTKDQLTDRIGPA